MTTTCSKTQKKLCGRRECNICWNRSLASYLKDNNLEHCWIQEKNENIDPMLITRGSHIKCSFRCKNGECNVTYSITTKDWIKSKGCSRCAINRLRELERFIADARRIHRNKYDYSKTEYIRSDAKVIILCSCGYEFKQKADHHLRGHGCPKCGGTKKSNTEEFIFKSKKIHGDKYDYSKVSYVDSKVKIIIICPYGHEFMQTPSDHLSGYGCPSCLNKTEGKLFSWLQEKYPSVQRQHKIESIPTRKYDIFIPELGLIIEVDGPQHFYQVSNWQSASKTQKIDILKMLHANKEGFTVIRIPQEYIWNDTHQWQDKLIEAIHKYDIATNIYLGEGDIYNNHISLLNRGSIIYQWKQNINSNEDTRLLHNILTWLKPYEKDDIFTIPRGDILDKKNIFIAKKYKLSPIPDQQYSGVYQFFTLILGINIEIDITDIVILIKMNIRDSLLYLLLVHHK